MAGVGYTAPFVGGAPKVFKDTSGISDWIAFLDSKSLSDSQLAVIRSIVERGALLNLRAPATNVDEEGVNMHWRNGSKCAWCCVRQNGEVEWFEHDHSINRYNGSEELEYNAANLFKSLGWLAE